MSSLGLWNTPVVVRFSIPKKAFTRLGKANLLKLMARLRTEHKCTALKRESSGRALFRLVAEGLKMRQHTIIIIIIRRRRRRRRRRIRIRIRNNTNTKTWKSRLSECGGSKQQQSRLFWEPVAPSRRTWKTTPTKSLATSIFMNSRK